MVLQQLIDQAGAGRCPSEGARLRPSRLLVKKQSPRVEVAEARSCFSVRLGNNAGSRRHGFTDFPHRRVLPAHTEHVPVSDAGLGHHPVQVSEVVDVNRGPVLVAAPNEVQRSGLISGRGGEGPGNTFDAVVDHARLDDRRVHASVEHDVLNSGTPCGDRRRIERLVLGDVISGPVNPHTTGVNVRL